MDKLHLDYVESVLEDQKMPIVEFTEELILSFMMLPMRQRIEKIAEHFSVSIYEAADINLLFILPAVTI